MLLIAALSQDVGIAELKNGYAADHILMTGDAHGNEKAAEVNGVLYYPFLVNYEAESLERFLNEAIDRFRFGDYSGT